MKTQQLSQLIGQKLYNIRKEHYLTRKQLGKLIGVSGQQVQKYEIGRDRISLMRLLELEKRLGFQLLERFRGLDEL